MLYFPWYDEDGSGYATYKEHYYNIIVHGIQTNIDDVGLEDLNSSANRLNNYIILMSSATASSFTRKGEGLHFSACHYIRNPVTELHLQNCQ